MLGVRPSLTGSSSLGAAEMDAELAPCPGSMHRAAQAQQSSQQAVHADLPSPNACQRIAVNWSSQLSALSTDINACLQGQAGQPLQKHRWHHEGQPLCRAGHEHAQVCRRQLCERARGLLQGAPGSIPPARVAARPVCLKAAGIDA